MGSVLKQVNERTTCETDLKQGKKTFLQAF